MRFAIYSRKSRMSDKGDSIGNQIEMCTDYINATYAGQVDSIFIYEDEGFSGGNISRPQFTLMLQAAKNKEFDVLVCYKLDRLSRKVSDFVLVFDMLTKHKVQCIFVKEHFDTTTPMGVAMMQITSVFAQVERSMIAERIIDNMYKLAETGRWLGGRAPYGFVTERTPFVDRHGNTKYYSMLKPARGEIEVVPIIFSKYIELGSIRKLAMYLNDNGYKNRNGNKFQDTAIRSLLTNPIYVIADKDIIEYLELQGCTVFRKEEADNKKALVAYARHDLKSGSGSFIRDMSSWVISVSFHDGVISSKQWIAANKKLARNAERNDGKGFTAFNDYALLSGMLYCKKCGGKMYCQPRTGKSVTRDGRKYFIYNCSTRTNFGQGACNCSGVVGTQVDDAIRAELANYYNDNNILQNAVSKLSSGVKSSASVDVCAQLKKDIDEHRANIDKLVMSLASGDLSETLVSYVDKKVKAENDIIMELSKQLTVEKAKVIDSNAEKQRLDSIIKQIEEVSQSVYSVPIPILREKLKLIIDKVIWDDEAKTFDVLFKE